MSKILPKIITEKDHAYILKGKVCSYQRCGRRMVIPVVRKRTRSHNTKSKFYHIRCSYILHIITESEYRKYAH